MKIRLKPLESIYEAKTRLDLYKALVDDIEDHPELDDDEMGALAEFLDWTLAQEQIDILLRKVADIRAGWPKLRASLSEEQFKEEQIMSKYDTLMAEALIICADSVAKLRRDEKAELDEVYKAYAS